MLDKLEMNGYPVIMSLCIVTDITDDSNSWKGSQYVGSYETIAELNVAINEVEVPTGWRLEIDFEDKPNDE